MKMTPAQHTAAMRELRIEMDRSNRDLAAIAARQRKPPEGRAALTPEERKEIHKGWLTGVPKRTGPDPKPDDLPSLTTFVRITDTEGHAAIVPLHQKEKHMAKFTLPTATTKAAPAIAPKKTPISAAPKAGAKPVAAKAAEKSTGAKRAPRPNGTGGRAAFAGFPLDAKITVVSKEHDFVEGSIRAKAFAGILKAKTVAAARDASNGDPWHLRTAVSAKRVKVG